MNGVRRPRAYRLPTVAIGLALVAAATLSADARATGWVRQGTKFPPDTTVPGLAIAATVGALVLVVAAVVLRDDPGVARLAPVLAATSAGLVVAGVSGAWLGGVLAVLAGAVSAGPVATALSRDRATALVSGALVVSAGLGFATTFAFVDVGLPLLDSAWWLIAVLGVLAAAVGLAAVRPRASSTIAAGWVAGAALLATLATVLNDFHDYLFDTYTGTGPIMLTMELVSAPDAANLVAAILVVVLVLSWSVAAARTGRAAYAVLIVALSVTALPLAAWPIYTVEHPLRWSASLLALGVAAIVVGSRSRARPRCTRPGGW